MGKLGSAAAVLILVLSTAACSPGQEVAERILESQEGVGDVEIDEEGGQVRIEGEDGSLSIGGGEVPEGFPIATPDNAAVQAVIEQENEASVSLLVDDDFESVKSFYEDWLDGRGEVANRIETSNPLSISWSIEDGSRSMSITIVEAGPDGVQVTLYSTGD